MNSEAFEKLTPQEREELALCGIHSAEQLQNSSLTQLAQDLQKAKRFFPGKNFTLTEKRLSEFFGVSPAEIASASSPQSFPGQRSAMPTTGYRSRSPRVPSDPDFAPDKQNNVIMHSPVRCTHTFTTLTAAFFTLFLIVPLASIIIFPVLMATDKLPQIHLGILATIIFIVPCLVYLLFAHKATCPVCHMRVFRFSHYNRNRAAHYLPFLGYNFTTALHLIFFLRYNCPGCGTPVKLTGVKGHRTHC